MRENTQQNSRHINAAFEKRHQKLLAEAGERSYHEAPNENRSKGILGRAYDPCRGSSGVFVQSETFVEEHGGRGYLATSPFCYTESFAKPAG